MKKSSIILSICGLALLSLTACEDFLNRPPYDDFTSEEYWKNEDQARTYVYSLYTTVLSGYSSGIYAGQFMPSTETSDDYVSDASQNDLTPLAVPETDGSWSFANIRKANYVLESIDRIDATDAAKDHWRGVARFFRACYYSNMVFTYGDVPWFDHVPALSDKKADLDYLYKDRDPRTYVDSMIMADFQFAMDNVRANDGALQVNKYVVAAMASRYMLREGTFLKYHNVDLQMAEQCIKFAKDAAQMVMDGPYSISDNYNKLFTSENLAGNSEVIMYRHYLDGIITHSTLYHNYNYAQVGASKSLAEAFSVGSTGLPVYYNNEFWYAPTDSLFFADRDGRLAQVLRTKYYVRGADLGVYSYALSGYSVHKFMDENLAGTTTDKVKESKNVTDAPCVRLGEVLLNYCEAAYELSLMNSEYTFGQADLDNTINLLRARSGVNMPALEIVGNQPAINGQTYDDPKRLELNPDGDVDAMLWEIRRERRVELCFEGFRANDLKRWKKLDYVWNGINPDIRFGCYIRKADYPNLDASVTIENNEDEGYVLRNTERERNRPVDRNYVRPIPSSQITLYKNHGYTLSQTALWVE